MPITDRCAVRTPPCHHYHQLALGETVTDLNAWATSLFSPQYSESHPAFILDAGGIRYFDGVGFNGVALAVGWYAVFDPNGTLTIHAPDDFARTYTPSA